MNYTIEQIREAWLQSCLDMWRDNIVDNNGSVEIEEMFERIGWGGFIGSGYRNTAKNAWCGIYQANAGLRIGDFLEPGACVPVSLDYDISHFVLPSTQRLVSERKWRASGVPMVETFTNQIIEIYPPPPPQPVFADCLHPGTVATIVTRKYGDVRDQVGGHYVCVERVRDDGLVDTVEGNAVGELGSGRWGEGVVRRRGKHARKLSDFRIAIEWDPLEHFEDLSPSLEVVA